MYLLIYVIVHNKWSENIAVYEFRQWYPIDNPLCGSEYFIDMSNIYYGLCGVEPNRSKCSDVNWRRFYKRKMTRVLFVACGIIVQYKRRKVKDFQVYKVNKILLVKNSSI